MRCDACHVAFALTLWAKFRDDGTDDELVLCGHDSDRHAPALVANEWAQVEDWRDPHRPALPALSGDPATH